MVTLAEERSRKRLDSAKSFRKFVMSCLLMGQDGEAAWVLWVRHETSSFEKVSHGGRVLSGGLCEWALSAWRTKVSLFDFEIENSGRTVQSKLDAQSLRLFGHHRGRE